MAPTFSVAGYSDNVFSSVVAFQQLSFSYAYEVAASFFDHSCFFFTSERTCLFMAFVAILIMFAINSFISCFRFANIVGIISLTDALMIVWISCARFLSSEVYCSMRLRTVYTRLWLDFGMGVWLGYFSVGILYPASKWVSDKVFEWVSGLETLFD